MINFSRHFETRRFGFKFQLTNVILYDSYVSQMLLSFD
jgi:hypothetical protein